MKILRLLLPLLLLAGCSMWQRVDPPHAEAKAAAFTVQLPLGWMRFRPESDDIALTLDGFDLNHIEITHRALEKAYPRLKKPAKPAMLPSELAELQIAEEKTGAKERVILVKDNAPALLADQAAYRLHLGYKNERGLMFDKIVYGLVLANGYYTLSYSAPALYYSARDLPTFEQTVASFKPNARP